MILEFAYGALQQLGRFVGGIPTALGWCGGSGLPSLPTHQVCGTVTIRPRITAELIVRPRITTVRINMTPRVYGTVHLGEC